MSLYYFTLKYGRHTVTDDEGEELADDAAAKSHAESIARDLMQSRELKTRFWRIEVCDDYLNPLFDLYFSEADKTIGHLPVEWRNAITTVSRTAGGLVDAVVTIQGTLAEVRATLKDADRLLATTRSGG
jgi:hypothetical protein